MCGIQKKNTIFSLFSQEYFPALALVLLHSFIWILLPSLYLGNLHQDALEAASWGREFAFGYPKHPPMTTWLIDFAIRIGNHPIFYLMIEAQVTVAITAFFIWKFVRKFTSANSAGIAVAIYMVSGLANTHAVIIDHNTFLAPLYAATLYFGLQYFENHRYRDSIALGIVVGLGALVKYEIAIAVIVLFSWVVAVPKYRLVLLKISSYASILIALAIMSPHLMWLYNNDGSCISYALGMKKENNSFDIFKSSTKFVVAFFKCFYAPLLFMAVYKINKKADIYSAPKQKYIAASLILLPSFSLLIMGFFTGQIFNTSWIYPLTVSTCMGAVLLFPLKDQVNPKFRTKLVCYPILISSLFLLFYIPQLFRSPVAYGYLADTKELSHRIEKLWADNSTEPLKCIVTNGERVGTSAVLWIKTYPKIINFSTPSSCTQKQVNSCAKTGGIAVIVGEDAGMFEKMTKNCPDSGVHLDLGVVYKITNKTWPIHLVYLAPNMHNESTSSSTEKCILLTEDE